MRKIVIKIAVLAAVVATSANAELKPGTLGYKFAHEKNLEKLCGLFSIFAESIMRERQKGTAIEEGLREIKKAGFDSRRAEMLRDALFSAYEMPRVYGTSVADEMLRQRRVIDDFRDRMHVKCLRDEG